MKKYITLIAMLFVGFVNAQSFNFNCDTIPSFNHTRNNNVDYPLRWDASNGTVWIEEDGVEVIFGLWGYAYSGLANTVDGYVPDDYVLWLNVLNNTTESALTGWRAMTMLYNGFDELGNPLAEYTGQFHRVPVSSIGSSCGFVEVQSEEWILLKK